MKEAVVYIASAYAILFALVAIGNGIAMPECAFNACSGFPMFAEAQP